MITLAMYMGNQTAWGHLNINWFCAYVKFEERKVRANDTRLSMVIEKDITCSMIARPSKLEVGDVEHY